MIELKLADDIAVLTMTHGKANALDLAFLDAIVARFQEQGRMFSAGVDLPRLTAGGVPYVQKFLPTLHRLYDTVFHHPKPVVAAVNGHAIAGG